MIPARANGQLAFGHHGRDGNGQTLIAHAITVLTLDGAKIAEITAFLTPEAFGRFVLPNKIKLLER